MCIIEQMEEQPEKMRQLGAVRTSKPLLYNSIWLHACLPVNEYTHKLYIHDIAT